MTVSRLISGPVLLGFGDAFEESIGAAVKKPAPPARPKPPAPKSLGATLYGPAVPVKRSETVRQHAKTLTAARTTAARVVKAIGQARQQLQRKPNPAPAKPKVAVGAAAAAKLSPRAKAAIRKRDAAIAKSVQANKTLAAQALKAKSSVVKLAKQTKAQHAVAARLRKPGSPATRVRGLDLMGDAVIGHEVQAIFGQYYTAVGAMPDPNNPGYLDDGSPDPAYMPAGGDLSLDAGLDPTLLPMDTEIEMPPAPGMDQIFPDMEAVGGIPYNGEKGYPIGYVGSLNYFTEKAQGKSGAFTDWYGYVFGGDPNKPSWPGDDPNTWVHVHGHHTGRDWWNNTTLQDALTSPSKTAPNGVKYGPLVGNPAFKDFAGMRVDSQGRMFWLPQEAPDWLTFPLKQAAAITAKAEKEAAEAAAKLEEAARAKEAADLAAEQARQEAELAMAERQAESEGRIEETRQQTEAQQALIEQQKADTEQQKAATEQQQIEAQQFKQVSDLLLEQARRNAAQPSLPQLPQLPPQQEAGGDEDFDEEIISEEEPDSGDYFEGSDDLDFEE